MSGRVSVILSSLPPWEECDRLSDSQSHGLYGIQASRWKDLCGWHRCCSDPDFSFNYWIYRAVLIMAMKSPIPLLFSCTPRCILRPRDNVAIRAAVNSSLLISIFLVVFIVIVMCFKPKRSKKFQNGVKNGSKVQNISCKWRIVKELYVVVSSSGKFGKL